MALYIAENENFRHQICHNRRILLLGINGVSEDNLKEQGRDQYLVSASCSIFQIAIKCSENDNN